MFQSYTFATCRRLPDRSRIAFKGTVNKWTPSPADCELEDALEQFARFGLGDSFDQPRPIKDSRPRLYDERPIPEEPYPGSYTGLQRPVGSQYSRTSTSSRRTICAPKMIEYPPQPQNNIDSTSIFSSQSRHAKKHQRSQYAPSPSSVQYQYTRQSQKGPQYQDLKYVDEVNNPKAMERYVYGSSSTSYRGQGSGSAYDNEVEIEPTDSISCVSSRSGGSGVRRHRYSYSLEEEGRGRSRTRRGEGRAPTVYEGTMTGRGGGCYDIEEEATSRYYETREIKPDY